jgi:sn-glycerol 3-phosphate transport system ATP-binding protein
MDEPLSNLDAQLRQEMRLEIRDLQRRLGITMLYVTHDQIEAMTMADQVVLLREGLIEQAGTPEQLYACPATTFAARFLGTPPMNVVAFGAAPGRAVGIRPEDIRIDAAGIPAKVESVEYLGADTLVGGRVGEESIVARVPGRARVDIGQTVTFAWEKECEHVFDLADGRRVDVA